MFMGTRLMIIELGITTQLRITYRTRTTELQVHVCYRNGTSALSYNALVPVPIAYVYLQLCGSSPISNSSAEL